VEQFIWPTVVNSKSVACFKNNLKRVDLSVFKYVVLVIFHILFVYLYFN